MIVVSDTSPLNYLAQMGQLDLLPQLYGQLLIPAGVANELLHPSAPVAVRALVVSAPPWLIRRNPAVVDASIGLGAGEMEAISLAMELKADRILMDDRAASKVAARRGLIVAGTLTVLAEAAERGLVNFSEAIAKLRATNFRVSDAVIAEFLRSQGGK